TDVEIEKITGKSVYDLVQKYGAIRFYSEEALVVKKISAREGLVIATGGSTVLNNENLRLLRKNGVVVLISSSPEVIYNRIKSSQRRPMLARAADLRRQIEELIAERKEVYRGAADFEVISGENSREEVVGQIVYFLRERKYI
ncbi:MAG: shikimate kinase, partial [Desulfocucumaceae bacterium]